LIDEIRAIKAAVSAEYGHDVGRLCRQLQEEQQAFRHRLVSRKPGMKSGLSSSPR